MLLVFLPNYLLLKIEVTKRLTDQIMIIVTYHTLFIRINRHDCESNLPKHFFSETWLWLSLIWYQHNQAPFRWYLYWNIHFPQSLNDTNWKVSICEFRHIKDSENHIIWDSAWNILCQDYTVSRISSLYTDNI